MTLNQEQHFSMLRVLEIKMFIVFLQAVTIVGLLLTILFQLGLNLEFLLLYKTIPRVKFHKSNKKMQDQNQKVL